MDEVADCHAGLHRWPLGRETQCVTGTTLASGGVLGFYHEAASLHLGNDGTRHLNGLREERQWVSGGHMNFCGAVP